MKGRDDMAWHEWKRTDPDFLVFDPLSEREPDWNDPTYLWLNEHLLVVPLGGDRLLATWTAQTIGPQGAFWTQQVAASRSADCGRTWSSAVFVDGTFAGGRNAAWQVPIVAEGGRIYLLYTCRTRGWHARGMKCSASEDGGVTWRDGVELPCPSSSPVDDPELGPMWICCSGAHTCPDGSVLIPFTRWADNPDLPYGACAPQDLHSQAEVMRFENLAARPEPGDIELVSLTVKNPVTVAHPRDPRASLAHEPYLANLPDGRVLMSIRTNRGEVWYAVSADNGATWRPAEPLLGPRGRPLPNPSCPCPVFRTGEHEYVLVFCNNDGSANGAEHPWDKRNRYPAYVSRGTFQPNAHQPISLSAPELFVDHGGVTWGPPGRERYEAAAYGSLTCLHGEPVFWYPDRKGFLVGRRVSGGPGRQAAGGHAAGAAGESGTAGIV